MKTLTDQQIKFIELSKQYEVLKKQMKELKPLVNGLLTEIGIDSYFQDPATKLVYKVKVPTGTYISFDTIGYDRTKAEDEKKGTLSKSEAKEKGFEL